MPGSFLRGNSDESIGGPVRVLIAEATYPHPEDLSHFFNTTTYDPNTTYGWKDAGFTGAPTRVRVGADVQRWSNQQQGQYRTVPTEWRGQVTSEFLQVTQEKKGLLAAARAGTTTAGGTKITDWTARANFPFVHIALQQIDHNGRIHVIYIPRAQWAGDDIEQSLERGQPLRIPMTWDIYADETLTNTTTGEAVLRRDFDQEG